MNHLIGTQNCSNTFSEISLLLMIVLGWSRVELNWRPSDFQDHGNEFVLNRDRP
jgi:hypothetical protein